MDTFVRRFIKSSLAWFAGGVLLGVAMAVKPELFRSARAAYRRSWRVFVIVLP